jgi:ubiquinol-cytochrome c reductase core subunit 2
MAVLINIDNNMVGLEHDVLVKSVEAALANKTTKKHEGSVEASKYSGGEFLVPASGHTHIALAFEGASLKGDAKDALAIGVLQQILGSVLNGNAAVQIGTGATSRLAVNVFPNNSAAYVISAFNFAYSDSGLFGVYAETRDAPNRLVSSITAELAKLRSSLSAEELAKGKAAFKLTLLDQGSRRTPALEFIGSHVLASGKAVTPEEYAAQVDSLTAEDVARVAKKVFSTRPTFVAVGDVAQLPTAEEIASSVNPK